MGATRRTRMLVSLAVVALIALAAIPGLAAFAHTLMRAEIEQRAHATLDPLTGLLNRKALAGRFAEIAGQATLTGAWVSVIE